MKVRDSQSGEVFLQEHFVLAVLYVQLRDCPAGVYGRTFLDFRKMFSATKKERRALLGWDGGPFKPKAGLNGPPGRLSPAQVAGCAECG
jgi:hypothetical protein